MCCHGQSISCCPCAWSAAITGTDSSVISTQYVEQILSNQARLMSYHLSVRPISLHSVQTMSATSCCMQSESSTDFTWYEIQCYRQNNSSNYVRMAVEKVVTITLIHSFTACFMSTWCLLVLPVFAVTSSEYVLNSCNFASSSLSTSADKFFHRLRYFPHAISMDVPYGLWLSACIHHPWCKCMTGYHDWSTMNLAHLLPETNEKKYW